MKENKPALKMSPFGYLFKFIGSWLGFAGLYAAFSVCPFCGQQGCPAGLAASGVIGGFLALCFQDWKRLFAFIINGKKNKKTQEVV